MKRIRAMHGITDHIRCAIAFCRQGRCDCDTQPAMTAGFWGDGRNRVDSSRNGGKRYRGKVCPRGKLAHLTERIPQQVVLIGPNCPERGEHLRRLHTCEAARNQERSA